MINFWIK